MTFTAQNKTIVSDFIDALFTKGDPNAVDDYLAEDFVNHDPPFGASADREGMRSAGAMFRSVFPDWHSAPRCRRGRHRRRAVSSTAGHHIAVILDAANASQLGSLVLAAHGLTPAQSRVAALVLQGRSTRHIVEELHISSNAVQEHLRAVFDRFGIGSRRELVAALSGRPR